MSEFKSLNGYPVKDEVARNLINGEKLTREQALLNEVESRNRAIDSAMNKEKSDRLLNEDWQYQLIKQIKAGVVGAEVFAMKLNTSLFSNINSGVMRLNRYTGEFIISFACSNANSVPSGSVIYTGLPKPDVDVDLKMCAYQKSNATYNILPVNFKLNTNGEIVTTSTVPADSRLYGNMNFHTLNWGGDYEIVRIATVEQVENAADLFKSWEGTIEYNNSITTRLEADTSLKSDCSGTICTALMRYGFSPAVYTTPLVAHSKIIAYAEEGKPLDLSEMRKGDIVAWSDDGGANYVHVAMCVGNGELYHESNYYNSAPNETKGPRAIADIDNYRLSSYKVLCRLTER